jgi:glyoxylase-like metal-dependent hydrolase (beta-lactamase superfamily II)/mannose-6-phosphate isomerase-like protein (cupin superfamily)
MQADIEAFFDTATATVSYVAFDPVSRAAAIIDPVLDFDVRSGHIGTGSAEKLLQFVAGNGLHVSWILETHVHADHLTAADFLRRETGAPVAIGAAVREVQDWFVPRLNLTGVVATDGSQFDRLLQDGEQLALGDLTIGALAVPGHTPADMAWQIGADVFVGDSIFMPDVGSARCDFPGGDAARLYASIRRLLRMDPQTRLWICHDYPPAGRSASWLTTVAEQRARNVHVRDGITEQEFVNMRRARDATLAVPALLWPSLQVNLRAGRLPEPEANGQAFLRIPLSGHPVADNPAQPVPGEGAATVPRLTLTNARAAVLRGNGRFAELFKHGSLAVEFYQPAGVDTQEPHTRDEVYVVASGSGEFVSGGDRQAFEPGEVLFVPAGRRHRFENFTADFGAWVFFYGPEGGEAKAT